METKPEDKPQNNNPSTAPQQPLPNQEADAMAGLLNFIKHPGITAIAGYLLGKYFEARKQEDEQAKITEKLERQIESLKEELQGLTHDRKTQRINQRESLPLNDRYPTKGMIQLD